MKVPLLEVFELRKSYGPTRALDGVSLQVHEGEIFGLLGPNGAGKTTLLAIVSGLLEASGGQVLFQGQPFHPRDRQRKRLFGIVPQELAIYNELTARENLRFFGQLYGIQDPELERRVTSILEAVGLVDRADQRASTFSGGMKRRLNLGAALVHQPRLLLLDEPTAGVDPQSRNHIFEEVRRLHALGLTIVYTSHYMEEVQALCSRIGILDHGKLIACDTLPNLLQQLSGVIRFRVPYLPESLRQSLENIPDARFVPRDSQALTLECRDVKAALLGLVALLNEENVELTGLEIEEPNLERVFLHLTGRALRD